MLRYSKAVGQYENNGTPIQALAVMDGGHYWNMAGGQEYLRTLPKIYEPIIIRDAYMIFPENIIVLSNGQELVYSEP